MIGIFNERMAELKNTFHALWKRIHKDVPDAEVTDEPADFDCHRNYEEDMPLTLAREDGPGARY